MPIYTVKCNQCGKQDDIFRKLSEFDNLPECCGEKTQRVICAPMVMADIQPYRSQIDGTYITSRSQHRKHLKAHNCIEVGNETKYLKPKEVAPPPGLKETLIEVANAKL